MIDSFCKNKIFLNTPRKNPVIIQDKKGRRKRLKKNINIILKQKKT
jgi:hypothetical protein